MLSEYADKIVTKNIILQLSVLCYGFPTIKVVCKKKELWKNIFTRRLVCKQLGIKSALIYIYIYIMCENKVGMAVSSRQSPVKTSNSKI